MMSLKCSFVAAGLLGALLGPAAAGAAPAAVSAQDTGFLVAAHQANLAEIAGGRLAAQKGADARVRALGARFAADHTALDAALTAVAERLHVPLPATPDAGQRALAERYRAASGAAFDRIYLPTQLTAHAGALALGKRELAQGSDSGVKKLAADAAPVVLAHHAAIVQAQRALGIAGYGAGPAR